MSEIILVTGATGKIGSQIVKQLVAAGAHVRAAVHSPDRSSAIRDYGAEQVEVELADRQSLRFALRGITRLFVLLPLVPNLADLARNVFEEAIKTGVKYIVHSSGMGADAPQPITLARWHQQAEKALQESGIPHTILRPNSFMQNYIYFAGATIRSQNAFYLPCGDGRVSLVDVRDIAAVGAVLLTKGGHESKAYNVVGPDALSNDQVANVLSDVLGRRITYVDVLEGQARQGMADAGLPNWLVEALLELYAVQKAGYAAEVSSAVELITGKKPITFQSFVTDHVNAFTA